MFVKPGPRQDDRALAAKEGREPRPLAVRAPTGRFISVLGEEVPDTQFWHRRVRDGDVVAAEPSAADPSRHIGSLCDPIPLDPVVVRVTADGTAIEAGDGEVPQVAGDPGPDPATIPHDEPEIAP